VKIISRKLYFLIALFVLIFCSSCVEIDCRKVVVTKVIDGDTFIIHTGQKIRLIGIDTPEVRDNKKLLLDSQRTGESIQSIKQKGQRALEFATGLIANKTVGLEFDEQKYDKYGRLLAYAWLEDETLINAIIIQEGYAIPLKKSPNLKYCDLFYRLYLEAKKNKKGIWKD